MKMNSKTNTQNLFITFSRSLDKHKDQKSISGTLSAILENCNTAEYNHPENGCFTKHTNDINPSANPRTMAKRKTTAPDDILKNASAAGKQSNTRNSPAIAKTAKCEVIKKEKTSSDKGLQTIAKTPPTSKLIVQTTNNQSRMENRKRESADIEICKFKNDTPKIA